MAAETDSRIYRTLILYPKPGKEEEVETHFSSVVSRASTDQPGVLQLHLYTVLPSLNTNPNTSTEIPPQIIGHAIYANEEAALSFHNSTYFTEFRKMLLEKELLARPQELFDCRFLAGFVREGRGL